MASLTTALDLLVAPRMMHGLVVIFPSLAAVPMDDLVFACR